MGLRMRRGLWSLPQPANGANREKLGLECSQFIPFFFKFNLNKRTFN